jgi:diguanylate cyclase
MASRPTTLTRLVLGNLADAPASVRERMLSTIPTTLLSLVFYSATLFVICLTAILINGAPWTWIWLIVSVVVVAWRAIHPVINRRAGKPPPLLSIMVSAGIGLLSFGYGSAASMAMGDVTLTAVTMAGLMGVVAGLATRWAALPRPAIAAMVLAVLPPVVTLLMLGGGHILAAISFIMVVASVAAFTIHNQEYLLAAITAEEMHRRMAQTDHLTGLANRAELMLRMNDSCAALPSPEGGRGRNFAVLYIDLDGFKAINDNHGHAAGDEVLQRVADCLRQVVGPDEMVARIGGDEFVALLSDADALTARAVADEIILAISRDHRIADGRALRVGCSVGICLAPDQGRDPEVLLARADAALYEVKNQGKGHTGVWRALSDA